MTTKSHKNYNEPQLDQIRIVLSIMRYDGTGMLGKKMSWERIIGEVGCYTELAVPEEKRELKNMAERFRQFVEGPDKKDPLKKRCLGKEELQHVIEYLTHPEVHRLTVKELLNPEISFQAAVYFSQFLFDGPVDENIANDVSPQGWFSDREPNENNENCTLLYIEKSEFSGVYYATQKTITVGIGPQTAHGWAIALPEKRLFVALKDMDTNKNLLMWDKLSDLRLGRPITEQYIYLIPLSPNSELIAPPLNKTILPFTSIKAPKVVSSDRPIVFKGVNSANLPDIMKCDNITINKRAKIKSISRFSIGTRPTKTHKRGVMSKEQEKILGEKLYNIIGKHNIEDRAATIAELLLQGAPLNYQDADTGNSYLHHAAATNDRKAINELIQHDDLNYLLRNKRKWLPSFMAQRAMNGYDMVEFFTEEEQAQGRREGLSVQLFQTMPIEEGPPSIKPLSNDMA